MEDHECRIHSVLEKLQEVGFYAELEKWEFHQSKVKFLGYIIIFGLFLGNNKHEGFVLE